MLEPEDFNFEVADLNEREILFKQQRETRGWDDSELWSLDCTITEFVLPRLIEFKKQSYGIIPGFFACKKDGTRRSSGQKRWNKALDKMITAFELMNGKVHDTPDNQKLIEKGLRKFSKYYRALWI